LSTLLILYIYNARKGKTAQSPFRSSWLQDGRGVSGVIKKKKKWRKKLRSLNAKERLKVLEQLLQKEDESLIGEPIAPCTGGRSYSEHYYRDLVYCK